MLFSLFKNELYLYLGEHGAEIDYIIGVMFNDLTNRLKDSSSDIQLSKGAKIGVAVGWNYFDAVYSFMLASSLLTDRSKYRYQQNLIKAVLNILSGIQLFVLTYNKPLNNALGLKESTSMAGVSFAIGTFLDAICATMDYYNARKEYYLPGWLDEQIKSYTYAKANQYDTAKLLRNIRARCKVFVNRDPARLAQLITFINNRIPNDVEHGLSHIELTQNLETVKYKHRERDQDIQYDLEVTYRGARTFIFMKGVSLLGMILIAVAGFIERGADNYPVLLTLGLAATTLVASYYFICNSEKIADKIGHKLPRFFSPDDSFPAASIPAVEIELQSMGSI